MSIDQVNGAARDPSPKAGASASAGAAGGQGFALTLDAAVLALAGAELAKASGAAPSPDLLGTSDAPAAEVPADPAKKAASDTPLDAALAALFFTVPSAAPAAPAPASGASPVAAAGMPSQTSSAAALAGSSTPASQRAALLLGAGGSDVAAAASQTAPDQPSDPLQGSAPTAAPGPGGTPAAAPAGRFDKLLQALDPAASGSTAPAATSPVADAAAAKPQASTAATAQAAAPAAPATDSAAAVSLPAPTVARMAPRITASPTAARDPAARPATGKAAAAQASDATAPTTAQPAASADAAAPGRDGVHALREATTVADKPTGEKPADAGDAPVATTARHADGAGALPHFHIEAPAPAASPADAAQPARLDPYRPAEQVAITLRQAAHDGNDRITIELKPASLGTVEVRLDFAHDGRVSASIVADRPDTLNLLKSDAGGLEQALRDAGLRADSGSLSFNLRGGDQQQPDPRQFQQGSAPAADAPRFGLDGEAIQPAAAAAGPRALRSHAGMLDIRI